MIVWNHYKTKLNLRRKRKLKKIKIKNLAIELIKIKYVDNPSKLQSVLKELNKIQVIDKNLHEIRHEILEGYTSEFEMVGNLKVGDQIRQTHIRFRNMDDYEAYINTIDEGYDAEDAIFKGCIYEINTPQFN